MKTLLAKSWPNPDTIPESAQLLGHLHDVYCAAETILGSSGSDQLAAFGLCGKKWFDRLNNVILAAASIHDLGKANNQFQAMIHGDRQGQDFRHEWISVWLAEQPAFKNWLLPALGHDERIWYVMLCCVAGHHPSVKHAVPTSENFRSGETTEVLIRHPRFHHCLERIADWFGLSSPPRSLTPVFHGNSTDPSSDSSFKGLLKTWRFYFHDSIELDDDWRRFCACAKACLIAADISGSALWEHIDDRDARSRWLSNTLLLRPSQQELGSIASDRLGGQVPRPFQSDVAGSDASVTLVEAGCGSGKTVAAYLWAAKQHVGKRLWFCYPTTGTATEGFLGYLTDPETDQARVGADLFHSRSNFDKLRLLSASDKDDAEVRIRSLMTWETKVVCCTVDTLLNLMQNQRSGLYAWPAIAGAAIVIDEIHCFDDILFGNLLTFLRELPGIPVLLMTASLPQSRKVAIEKACRNRTFHSVPGPDDLERLPRYVHANHPHLTDRTDALAAAQAEFEQGGRVLWVSNTVSRTWKTATELSQCDPVVYHSRFIYKHRLRQHQLVTAMFDRHIAGIASTSQVAEMSLDLGLATLLVSELAPIPALIQRLGRLNRRATPEMPPEQRTPRRFLIIEPINDDEFVAAPYEEQELELARRWLEILGPGPLSQCDLVLAWHQLEDSRRVRPADSAWLDGGIETPVNPIRQSSYGVTVIRQRDVAAARGPEGTAAYALPMNRPTMQEWQTGYLCGGFPVATDSSIDYCEHTGARWSSFLVL